MTLLVGDIGGTNSRFGRLEPGATRPADVRTESTTGHASFEDALAVYLAGSADAPTEAAFAVAGPVTGRAARITNRGWEIDADATARRFGLSHVLLLNDFVAQAAALPHLGAADTALVGDVPAAPPDGTMTRAAVGPGTGLGVAGLVWTGDRWLPIASEGGHVELAPVGDRERAVFDRLRPALGRVSAEAAICGPAIGRLYDALATIDGTPRLDEDAAGVAARAVGGEPLAREAIALFWRLLARFAGDVALTFQALGGVAICGGVAPRLAGFLDPAAFRAGFEAKTPHEGLMRRIPTAIVTSPVAGLIGCAAVARQQGLGAGAQG